MRQHYEVLSGSHRLHNMSAPPIMTISMHPVHSGKKEEVSTNHNLFGVVNLSALFTQHIKNRYDIQTKSITEKCMMLAEYASGITPQQEKNLTAESIFDRFSAAMLQLDKKSLSIPSVAIVLPAKNRVETTEIRDVTTAMTLVSSISGTLFIASRMPHLPPAGLINRAIAFYTMHGGDA